jgi:hypothetical protein
VFLTSRNVTVTGWIIDRSGIMADLLYGTLARRSGRRVVNDDRETEVRVDGKYISELSAMGRT